MIFQADITIPASTSSDSPEVETVRISQGVITELKVRPRPGHASLAHCVIKYHNHQIAPSTEGMDFHGDADPIDWTDQIEVPEPPFTLEIVGWNDDDTYEHTFTIYIVILQKSALPANSITSAVASLFRALLPSKISKEGF